MESELSLSADHSDATPPFATETPDDDAGSETLARYEFQVMLTALECVRLLASELEAYVVCEWWEDFVVRNGAEVELVSVKHVEPSRGAWTLARLIEDGGLKHLFERWRRSQSGTTCRLMTNGGLKAGANEAAGILAATRGTRTEEVAALIAPRLGASDASEAAAFLIALSIDAELPKRDDLLARLIVDVLPPFADQLGWTQDEIPERFGVVSEVVRRAAGSDIQAAQREPGTSGTIEARVLARKTVTRERLRDALGRPRGTRATRMVRKLRAGGFGPTDIEQCKRLRSDWLRMEYRYQTGLGGDDEPGDRIRRVVQDFAVTAERQTRSTTEPYGELMRDALIALLGTSSVELGNIALSTDALLGAVYDETDHCRIWWSSPHAVEALE